MKIRKIIALILTLTMIIALIPISRTEVEAASTASVVVTGQEDVLPGSTATVDISIKDNPGILGAVLKLEYDSNLTLKEIKAGDAFSSLTLTKPGQLGSGCKFVWDGQEVLPEDIKDGIIISLTFDVSATAEAGAELPISVSFEDAVDKDLNAVEIVVTDGKICLQKEKEPVTVSFITTEKALTTYEIGDVLNVDDIKVTAVYSDDTKKAITEFKTNVESIDMQEEGAKELVVSYEENDIVVTSVILIQVLSKENTVHQKDAGTKVEPTCEKKGSLTYKCIKCGEVIEVVELTALGHTWDEGRVTKEPTETEEGVKTYTCKRCGKTKTESIPKKQVQAEEGLYTENGTTYYEDAQGVTYGFYNDGVSCYVKGYTDNIIPEVTIPAMIVVGKKQYTVTVIEEKAFYGCDALAKIKLPNTITAIKEYAFAYTNLKVIEIPKSVTEIVDTAFTSYSLTDISISKDNPKYSSDKQGCVYNKDKTVLIFALYTVKKVVIPKTVKTIGEFAFFGTNLRSVKISNSVEKIKANAFGCCANLKSINIPNSVKVIDGWAFEDCDELKKVTIGKNVTQIGKYAFEGCSKLKTVVINSTKLKTIGTGAFSMDKKLTSIVLKTTKLTKKSIKANVLKGTNKKLVIKVPKKMLSKYKKYFKNKGNKTVKVKQK